MAEKNQTAGPHHNQTWFEERTNRKVRSRDDIIRITAGQLEWEFRKSLSIGLVVGGVVGTAITLLYMFVI